MKYRKLTKYVFKASLAIMAVGMFGFMFYKAPYPATHFQTYWPMYGLLGGLSLFIAAYLYCVHQFNKTATPEEKARIAKAQAQVGASVIACQVQNIIQAQSNRIITGSDPIDIFKK